MPPGTDVGQERPTFPKEDGGATVLLHLIVPTNSRDARLDWLFARLDWLFATLQLFENRARVGHDIVGSRLYF